MSHDAIVRILNQLDEALTQLGGCGDGNCCIKRPVGLHTNGGCRCVGSANYQRTRFKIEKALRTYQNAVSDLWVQVDTATIGDE